MYFTIRNVNDLDRGLAALGLMAIMTWVMFMIFGTDMDSRLFYLLLGLVVLISVHYKGTIVRDGKNFWPAGAALLALVPVFLFFCVTALVTKASAQPYAVPMWLVFAISLLMDGRMLFKAVLYIMKHPVVEGGEKS